MISQQLHAGSQEMNILRSIGLVAVTSFICLGLVEVAGPTTVPGFLGVITTARAEVGRP